MYTETTRSIKVTVRPIYLDDQSSPDENHFVWAYRVLIENLGGETVQLRSRHWRITDGIGRRQEVKGAGVIGEQPVLAPGQSFEYQSGTPLSTPSGIMDGTYQHGDGRGRGVRSPHPAHSPHQPCSGTRGRPGAHAAVALGRRRSGPRGPARHARPGRALLRGMVRGLYDQDPVELLERTFEESTAMTRSCC
jgi:ApaG protein